MSLTQEKQEESPISDKKSALQESLETKKDQSYYYAHKPRGNIEERAPLPIHHVLQRTSILQKEQNESIYNYQFLDDDKNIKIYIPLENIGTLGDENIYIDIKENSVYLSVKGLKEGKILILNIKELYGDILPLNSFWKKKENKLILSLTKKADDDDGNCVTWRQLKK